MKRGEIAMKRKALLALIFIFIFSITFMACQKSPDYQAVIPKNNEDLQRLIEETASPSLDPTQEISALDNSWKYEKNYNSGIRLTINADVINIQPENVPVISIREKPFEDMNQMKTIVENLCPDYTIRESTGSLSKEAIEASILFYKEMLYKIEHDNEDHDLNNANSAIEGPKGANPDSFSNLSKKEQITLIINDLEKQYQIAPSIDRYPLPNYQMKKQDNGSSQNNILANNGKDFINIDFVNWDYRKGSLFQYTNNTLSSSNSNVIESFILPSNWHSTESLTNEIIFVDQIVKEHLGIEYMTLNALSKRTDGFDYYYVREVNGFPETYTPMNFGEQQTDTDDFIDLWRNEYLYIKTLHGSIVDIKWQNPSAIVNIDNDNVQVINYKTAQNIFLKQMDLMLSPNSSTEDGQAYRAFFQDTEEVNIVRIEFGLTKLLMQNSEDLYKLIPTWSFMGYPKLKDSTADETESGAQVCFVTINALDGSIVDRNRMN